MAKVRYNRELDFLLLVPKPALRLVQSSFAKRYFMNAILGLAWAVTVPLGDDMVMR